MPDPDWKTICDKHPLPELIGVEPPHHKPQHLWTDTEYRRVAEKQRELLEQSGNGWQGNNPPPTNPYARPSYATSWRDLWQKLRVPLLISAVLLGLILICVEAFMN